MEEQLKEILADFRCENLVSDVCEARSFAKSLQVLDGVPMCLRPCCIGCEDRPHCGYYCCYADSQTRYIRKEIEQC